MQNLIRFTLLSVLVGSLLIAAGCQQSEEVVVEESVAPVVEESVAPLGEVSVEVETEAAGEAAAQ